MNDDPVWKTPEERQEQEENEYNQLLEKIELALKNLSFDLKTIRQEQREIQKEIENINELLNRILSTPTQEVVE